MRTHVSNPTLVIFLIVAGAAAQTAEQTPMPQPATAPPAVATNVVGPKIRFESEAHDFGRIMAGATVRHDFIFTNAGDSLLEISGVATTCGCTTPGDWTRQLEPGKTGVIPLQFHAPAYPGAVAKTVTVTCNDKERSTVPLQIKGTVWKPVDVNPQFAVLSANTETIADAKTTVRIVSNEEEPLTLSTPECNNSLFVVELKTNQPGKEFELLIKAVPAAGTGNLQGMITLKTSSTNAPVLNITAIVSMQPVLTITPPQINLPAAHLANKATYNVSIRYAGTNALALSAPTVNAKDVTVELKELDPGRAFSMAVSFPTNFEAEPGQQTELSVNSNHRQFRIIKVPIAQPPRPAVPPSKPAPVPATVPPPIGPARAPLQAELPPPPPAR